MSFERLSFYGAVSTFLLIVCIVVYCFLAVQTDGIKFQEAREQEIEDVIIDHFNAKLYQLKTNVESVSRDRELISSILSLNKENLSAAFLTLQKLRSNNEVTLDIVDTKGNILCWIGQSVQDNFSDILSDQTSDTIAFVSQSGFLTFLSFALYVDPLFIIASIPLELQYPVSNRLVSPVLFSKALEQSTGTNIKLVIGPTSYKQSDEWRVIGLKDLRGISIVFAVYNRIPIINNFNDYFSKYVTVVKIIAAICFLFIGMYFILRFWDSKKIWISVVGITSIIWGFRFSWSGLEIPYCNIGIPYEGVLSHSLIKRPIECLFTLLFILITFIVTAKKTRELVEKKLNKTKLWSLIIIFIILCQYSLLSFAVGTNGLLQSINLSFFGYSDIIPDFPRALLLVGVTIISLTQILIFYFFIIISISLLKKVNPLISNNHNITIFLFALFWILISFVLWEWLFEGVVLTWVYVSFIVFLTLVLLIQKDILLLTTNLTLKPKFVIAILFGMIILAVPILINYQEKTEQLQLKSAALELLESEDKYLKTIAGQSLASVKHGITSTIGQFGWDEQPNSKTALTLWSNSVLGQEGFNSAIILYDRFGREMSSFSVGIPRNELIQLQNSFFQSTNRSISSLEVIRAQSKIAIYGVWDSLFSADDRHLGYVIVIVWGDRKVFFRSERAEPLRSSSAVRLDLQYRDFFINEYKDYVLTFSSHSYAHLQTSFPSEVKNSLSDSSVLFVWGEKEINGKEYKTIYTRDLNKPANILELSLEKFDIRIYLLNILQFIVFCGLILSVVTAGLHIIKREKFKIGFRGKLIIAFGILSLLPAIILVYYNRQIAFEHLTELNRTGLYRNLELIENKISYLKTVDEFWRVVNNDFCIEVATDLGIDFNIFRDGYLYSSSRPELYDAQILDRRMPADAYRITAILGSEFYFENDKVGISEYTIGFKSIRIAEQTVGVLAIPTLFQQEEVFRELAQRNALLAGIYFAVLFLIVGISVLFANRMTQPLRRLQTAAHAIGEGNLNITVTSKANDETGALVKAFNQMVSEIKQRREEQAQYERDLAWKEMAKQVAHEIKNPLTPMKLSVQHLQQAFKDKVKDFDKIVFRVTKTIIEQIDSLARIATEFSHFSRMPVRKFESVELHNLLEETISLFKGVKGIEIQKEFSIINPIVIADKDELRRVFINIVRNSVQAIEKNGLIKMQTSVQNDKCTISISDTGIGIQPEHLPNVLKPNFSTKAGGMGLGLAICRQIITDLNGSINVSSVYGRGTKVEIILPVSQNIA